MLPKSKGRSGRLAHGEGGPGGGDLEHLALDPERHPDTTRLRGQRKPPIQLAGAGGTTGHRGDHDWRRETSGRRARPPCLHGLLVDLGKSVVVKTKLGKAVRARPRETKPAPRGQRARWLSLRSGSAIASAQGGLQRAQRRCRSSPCCLLRPTAHTRCGPCNCHTSGAVRSHTGPSPSLP